MRLCLGAVVETKDAGDDVGVVGGNADGADAAAEISLGMTVFLQFDAEGFLKLGDSAGDKDGAAGGVSAGFLNFQGGFLGGPFDLGGVAGIGALRAFVLGARHWFEVRFFKGGFQSSMFGL